MGERNQRGQGMAPMRSHPDASTSPDETADEGRLNPYVRVIVEEARARHIEVRVVDPAQGQLHLSHGGRDIVAIDSLTELTSAVAMIRCSNKDMSRAVLEEAGLAVPRGREATFDHEDEEFLAAVGELAVKPASGEQADGVTVGVHDPQQLEQAVAEAHRQGDRVLLEERVRGLDVRVIVIDHAVAAAAVRRPPEVTGTGRHSIAALIERRSHERAAATDGESTIPLDEHAREAVADAGYAFDDVLPEGKTVVVQRTANLHTGGTMHDVTDNLHPDTATACVRASRALRIPVVGLDLMVPCLEDAEHVFLEANERPGLAFHDPAPVVQRFVDLLFPETATP